MKKKITIAIDGHSACGKSTLAKGLAKALNYRYVDSGAMYRGATLYALKNDCFVKELDEAKLLNILDNFQLDFKIISGINTLFLNGENVENEIRQPHIAERVSKVARIKEVRQKMVAQQKTWGENGGIVMDGRDIGSVVFPDAELKLFVTASIEVRTQRRLDELKNNGVTQNFDEVEKNLSERDYLDSTRKESPLIQVEDAIVLDNSELSIEEQLDWAIVKVNEILNTSPH
ncbi:MAG: (d)CMP kinase [Flavobacteriales bacterium]|nr:MAG: (d)CMP kinase [Flavobacteriales bacterium]